MMNPKDIRCIVEGHATKRSGHFQLLATTTVALLMPMAILEQYFSRELRMLIKMIHTLLLG
jgi:hypothetical protein